MNDAAQMPGGKERGGVGEKLGEAEGFSFRWVRKIRGFGSASRFAEYIMKAWALFAGVLKAQANDRSA